jgi:hypothetical protein
MYVQDIAVVPTYVETDLSEELNALEIISLEQYEEELSRAESAESYMEYVDFYEVEADEYGEISE